MTARSITPRAAVPPLEVQAAAFRPSHHAKIGKDANFAEKPNATAAPARRIQKYVQIPLKEKKSTEK